MQCIEVLCMICGRFAIHAAQLRLVCGLGSFMHVMTEASDMGSFAVFQCSDSNWVKTYVTLSCTWQCSMLQGNAAYRKAENHM